MTADTLPEAVSAAKGRSLVPTNLPAPVVDPTFLDRLTALRQTLAPTLNDAELELFGIIAQRKNLDPFSGQIIAVKRNTPRGARVTFQTTIDGLRSIAERTEQYLGSDEPEFGPACGCGKPTSYHPEWARVIVHRLHPSGRVVSQPAKAKWHEFVPPEDFMWVGKPEVMLGKTAEAQALRKAFPWVLNDIYVPEEMARDEAPGVPAVVSAREVVAQKAAEIRGGAEGDADESAEAVAASAEAEPQSPASPFALSAEEFRERMKGAGISVARAKEVSERLYPGRSSASLEPEEWGALWTALTT